MMYMWYIDPDGTRTGLDKTKKMMLQCRTKHEHDEQIRERKCVRCGKTFKECNMIYINGTGRRNSGEREGERYFTKRWYCLEHYFEKTTYDKK